MQLDVCVSQSLLLVQLHSLTLSCICHVDVTNDGKFRSRAQVLFLLAYTVRHTCLVFTITSQKVFVFLLFLTIVDISLV